MNITVIYSLPTRRVRESSFTAADEDTGQSAREVAEALSSRGERVSVVGIGEDSVDSIRDIRADVVFNLIEWSGLDLPLSDRAFALLERSGVPFTGASRKNFLLTSDKLAMKRAFDASHVPTAPWQAFRTGRETVRRDMPYPAIVKYAYEQASVGISKQQIAHNGADLQAIIRRSMESFGQPVYAEAFIRGKEYHVGVLEIDGVPVVLPPAAISFDTGGGNAILTYNKKWRTDLPEYASWRAVPAQIPAALTGVLADITRNAYRACGCRDYVRADFRVAHGIPYMLEINANPSLTDDDEYAFTVSYTAFGLTFSDVVWDIVRSALRRKKLR